MLYEVITSLTGLAEVDRLMIVLAELAGCDIPSKYQRQRSRLADAMVDTHYQFGLKKVALACEADLLKTLTPFLHGMGCDIRLALSATRVRGLDELPAATVAVITSYSIHYTKLYDSILEQRSGIGELGLK